MLSFSVADYITRHHDLSILAKQMHSLGDPTMQMAFDDMDVCWADAVKDLSPIQAFIIDRTWNGNFNDDAIGLECGKSVSWVKHTRHDSFEILDQYYRDRLQLDLMPFARKKEEVNMGFFADRKAKKEAKKAARKKKSLKEYARSKVFGNVMSDEDFDKFCKTAEAERAQREKNDNQGYFVYTADYGYSSGVMIKNSEVCQYFDSIFEIREWVRQSLLGNNHFGGYSYNPHKILRFLPIISEFVDGNKMRRILRITDASGREYFNAAKRTITNEMESLLKSLP